jgi:hypothetical protein
MKPDLEDKILKDFPTLFDTNEFSYIECLDGWYQLIYDLCGELAKDDAVKVYQIKEKFGGLRVYINSLGKFEIIKEAEEDSLKICEMCGTKEDVKLYNKSWKKTLCHKHAIEFYGN